MDQYGSFRTDQLNQSIIVLAIKKYYNFIGFVKRIINNIKNINNINSIANLFGKDRKIFN